MYTIYKITNNENGKIYIGMTKQPLAVRFKSHMDSAKYPQYVHYLANAIRHYGTQAFSVEEIDRANSREEAAEKEKEYIKKFSANNPEIGYNMTVGGESHHDTETGRERKRQAMLGRKITPEHARKIGQARKMGVDLEQIERLYLEGMGSKVIAKQIGVSSNTVLRRLKELGVEMRSLSESQKLVSQREEYHQNSCESHRRIKISIPEVIAGKALGLSEKHISLILRVDKETMADRLDRFLGDQISSEPEEVNENSTFYPLPSFSHQRMTKGFKERMSNIVV